MKMKGKMAAFTALLALCLIFAASAGAEEKEETLPAFTFTAVGGQTIQSEELKATPLVVVMQEGGAGAREGLPRLQGQGRPVPGGLRGELEGLHREVF
jgi:hypothetical protein